MTTKKAAVYLTNKTEAPIHIMAKSDEGTMGTIVVAPTDVVEVPAETLKIGGVKQLLDEGKLKEVDEATAASIKAEHDKALESEDE